MRTLLGIDVGTQGTKAAVFSEEGRCLGQAFVPSKLHRPKPGVVEEDPEVQFDSVCRTIRECVAAAGIDPASVAGIGMDGQMAGLLGVGKDGRHVTPYDSWLDTRCGPYIKIMDEAAGDEIVAKTGGPPSFNHGPKKLWWMHQRKPVFRKIAAFVQPGGYAAMRLCGLKADQAFIDKTYLHFSGFADNRRSRWDEDLCRRFGFDPAKLARIVSPQAVVGEVIGPAARKCGLRPGVPVVAGCGDTAASFLACGAVSEGICVDVAGTASVFATTAASFRADRKHRMIGCGQSAVPGLWHPYAYINGGGMNLEWFRRELANRGATAGRGLLSFEDLNERVDRIEPREDSPLFVPHLGGRVCPGQPELRGAWAGLSWDHTLTDLYRAVLEGVALEYAVYKKVLLELYGRLPFTELRITGGGEKSGPWNRLKADALQMPVRRIARSEGAPLGAALVAGHGVGVFADLPEAARRWIALGEKTQPKKALAGHYQRRLVRYEKLLECLQ
jgi:xylulokinase